MIGLDAPTRELLAAAGVDPSGITSAQTLPGGVSSDVTRLSGERDVVVKRPLAELKVGDGWHAELDRTANEVAFAAVLTDIAPRHALAVLAFDADRNIFVMQAAPPSARSWKQDLMAGRIDTGVAAVCGRLLASIHDRGTAHPGAAGIEGAKHFESLRIEPFLRYVLPQHPQVAEPVTAVIDHLTGSGTHLVHGDFSPKNILVSPGGGVHLIDHEVAHLGNPVFDLAFVTTHLLLKAYHLSSAAALTCGRVLLQAYQEAGAGPVFESLGQVTAALLLARVDGRSQAEYLDQATRDLVRTRALAALAAGTGWKDLHTTVAKDIST